MNAPAVAELPHHLPVLRRGLRRGCARGGRRDRRGGRHPRSPGQPRAPVREGLRAARDRRARGAPAAPGGRRRARDLGPGAGARGRRLRARDRRARAAGGRLLPLGTAAHRGLLRRQQADEGLHRQRQRRYQLAAVHGLGGGGLQARLRRRRGAVLLRGSGVLRAAGAHAVPTPRGPTRCCTSASRRPSASDRHARGGDRSAAHRELRPRRPAPARSAPAAMRCSSPRCWRTCSASGASTHDYVAAHTEGFDAALAAAGAWDPARASEALGIAPEALQTFCDWFAATERTVTFYSQGINQSATGTDKCNAIINCHLATGRIGRAGMRAVLDHRPAERDGRARGGRAGEPARGAHGFHARGHRARGALLGRAEHGDARPA